MQIRRAAPAPAARCGGAMRGAARLGGAPLPARRAAQRRLPAAPRAPTAGLNNSTTAAPGEQRAAAASAR
jgi:hypothetical protein